MGCGVWPSGIGVGSREINGAAVGIINGLVVEEFHRVKLTEKVNGVFIGILNVTRQLNGLQLGILNYAGNNPPLLRLLPVMNLHLGRGTGPDE